MCIRDRLHIVSSAEYPPQVPAGRPLRVMEDKRLPTQEKCDSESDQHNTPGQRYPKRSKRAISTFRSSARYTAENACRANLGIFVSQGRSGPVSYTHLRAHE